MRDDSETREISSSGSAQHILAVLEAYDETAAELGVSELARRVCLPRSTVHRTLKVLEGRRFVVQNPLTRKYRLGWKLFVIGSLVARETNLGEETRPYAEQLALETGEVVHVSIIDGGEVVHIEKVDSPQTLYVRSYVGQRAPAHATAAGKVLLAHLEADDLQPLLAEPLKRYTERTITDPVVLLCELTAIKARGYAMNPGEWRSEAVGVAAPVRDYSGRVVAALDLVGPASRLSGARLEKLAPVVCRAAAAASAHLGWLGSNVAQPSTALGASEPRVGVQ